ncbi:MAG: MerR family transcriptional regulator [Maricaulaceae bacterium]|nr:MerR family transcriptional regulator [Maricaulaceae bacterium]
MTDAGKSPDAYRTISEAAAELDVPAHVLRFWESKFAQLKPVKRAGGRRFYRPSDLALLHGIKRLLYAEGYTIKGAQKFIREHGVGAVGAMGEGEVSPKPLAERFIPPAPAKPAAAPVGGAGRAALIRRLETAKARLDAALSARG